MSPEAAIPAMTSVGGVPACHIGGSVSIVEDVEQRTVDDGVVAPPLREVGCRPQRVSNLESCVNGPLSCIAAGGSDRARRDSA